MEYSVHNLLRGLNRRIAANVRERVDSQPACKRVEVTKDRPTGGRGFTYSDYISKLLQTSPSCCHCNLGCIIPKPTNQSSVSRVTLKGMKVLMRQALRIINEGNRTARRLHLSPWGDPTELECQVRKLLWGLTAKLTDTAFNLQGVTSDSLSDSYRRKRTKRSQQ